MNMNLTLLLAIVILLIGAVFMINKYLEYKKHVGQSPNYVKQVAIRTLFLGFTLLVGLSSIFADVLFSYLKLDKPQYFETITLVAYTIFSVGVAKIAFSPPSNLPEQSDIPETPHNNQVNITTKNTGSGTQNNQFGKYNTMNNVKGNQYNSEGDMYFGDEPDSKNT